MQRILSEDEGWTYSFKAVSHCKKGISKQRILTEFAMTVLHFHCKRQYAPSLLSGLLGLGNPKQTEVTTPSLLTLSHYTQMLHEQFLTSFPMSKALKRLLLDLVDGKLPKQGSFNRLKGKIEKVSPEKTHLTHISLAIHERQHLDSLFHAGHWKRYCL